MHQPVGQTTLVINPWCPICRSVKKHTLIVQSINKRRCVCSVCQECLVFTSGFIFSDGDLVTIAESSDLNLAKQLSRVLKINVFSESLPTNALLTQVDITESEHHQCFNACFRICYHSSRCVPTISALKLQILSIYVTL